MEGYHLDATIRQDRRRQRAFAKNRFDSRAKRHALTASGCSFNMAIEAGAAGIPILHHEGVRRW